MLGAHANIFYDPTQPSEDSQKLLSRQVKRLIENPNVAKTRMHGGIVKLSDAEAKEYIGKFADSAAKAEEAIRADKKLVKSGEQLAAADKKLEEAKNKLAEATAKEEAVQSLVKDNEAKDSKIAELQALVDLQAAGGKTGEMFPGKGGK